MKKPALDARLRAAAAYVRQDAVFADVGTDHAYLPLFLLSEGRIARAVCSDIHEGPLAKAREHAAEYPFLSKMSFHLANGLDGLGGEGITDIAVCGMGGELIAEIIDRAPHLKDERVNLILQPMTKQEKLRVYLAAAGFEILSESYCFDAGKTYLCILAKYSGQCREISDLESEIGSNFKEYVNKSAQIAYIKGKISAYDKAYEGKVRGENSADFEEKMLTELKNALAILEQN